MPTPLGHALAGIAAGTACCGSRSLLGHWRDLLLFSLAGQIPDLDFVPGIIMGDPDLYHHGVSHSVGAALIAGGLFYLWGLHRKDALRWGLMGFFVVLSHVLIDALCTDTSPPSGVPLLWPFSQEYYLIYPLFLDVWRSPLALGTLLHNLKAMALESALLGNLALGCILWRRRQMLRQNSGGVPGH